MNSPRFLSFAIPGAIIVFAIAGNAVMSLAQRNSVISRQRGTVGLLIKFGVGIGVTLLVVVATIYSFENLT